MRSILSNSPYKVQLGMIWQTIATEIQVLSACETDVLNRSGRDKSGCMNHFMPVFYEE